MALGASDILETNHERTLYVPYVFCNHLISRQQNQLLSEPRVGGFHTINPAAAGSRRPSLQLLPVQTADGSQVPMPQRDLPAARNPDDRPAWQSARGHRAP